MAELQKLHFTKRWTNPTDFPTHEPDENTVREDLQFLHDETADYINDVLLDTVGRALDETISETERITEDAIVGALPDGTVGSTKLADYLKAPLVAVLNK